MVDAYPLLLRPVYKDYIWGGEKIARLFHRSGLTAIVAESWEVSDREDGMSVIENGLWEGLTLHQALERFPELLVGPGVNAPRFPLLVKLIDAKQNLSLQVHPDEKAAAALGAEPKTEMWYILQADPDAAVYVGFTEELTGADLLAALQKKTLKERMRKIPVKSGDIVSVPAGRVHAIGAGCLLLEVQQNSNTTYRLYDWDRIGKDGRPRQLHLKEGMEAIHWKDHGDALVQARALINRDDVRRWSLLTTTFFVLERIDLMREVQDDRKEKGFAIYFALEGDLVLRANGTEVLVPFGRTCLVPAACDPVFFGPALESVRVAAIYPPRPRKRGRPRKEK